MKDIIKLIKYTDISYMKRQIGCMIFLLLNTVLTLVYPSCISVIVDQGVAKGSIEDIIKYSILMFVLGILIMITNYVQQIKYAKLGREICEILRNRMFEKLCKTNYKFWCENRVGDIITILDTDVSLVEKILTSIISCGILNILYFSGIIMVLLLCNVKTGFLITILVFLFVLLQKKNGKKVKRGMSELREKIGWFNSETQEMIHNMPDIQLIYPEKDLVNSYMQQNRLTNMSYIQQTKNMLEAKNIGWGFNILSIFSVLLIGGYAVLREDISVGILFSMIVYVQQLYSPAVALGETYNSIKNAQPSILRISTLLENKEMVEEADFCPEGSLKGNIIFKNVTFSYAQNTDPVFRNLNLSLKAGRIYGITGDNGMGKSTFIRLIAGLCMPDSGNIYIDDIEIKKYNVEYLRKHIGYKGPVLKEEKKEEITLNGLTLMIIQECNLRCTYCYGEGGEYQDRGKMSLETAKKSIDFLIGNSKNKELLICFLGGEPLMNFPLIKDVVAYCNKYENDKPIHFKYTITTNGTIWNDEIETFLREKHFTVQISVDGNKDVHNCNRFYANGLGSFDVMEKNTRNMRNDGLVSGRATITATNLDLVDNFKALNDMKFRSIPMAPAQNLLSDEDYDRLIGENTKLVQYFLELIQSGDYKTAKKLRILMSGLQKIHKSGVARKILCGVGSAQLAVDINGEIYPCHRFVANKEYAMGNVLKDTKIEKMPFLEEITLEKHKECKNCWARNLCVGACPNENLVNAGTTQKSDSKNCRFIQAMYNDLIHAYLELTVENKKQLLG